MRVKHASLFEAVKIVSPADENERSMEQMPIQKIMSVPVVRTGGEVMGVVQVSRKGLDASGSGADFTSEDLKQLEQGAEILSRMAFMQEGAEF
jgi:hypothetical protein